ncbi:MAG: hypothetical protein EBY39_05480 [Flavobacteriia bacterium]|nr:hypothetical protein [Flavobacteriia bacterium]
MKKINLPKIIGISGVARCGKDTFFLLSTKRLNKSGQKTVRCAFADAVKQDCHQLLVKKAGISAFTQDDEQKKLIRPLLVAYGHDLMRKLDPEYWIKRIELSLALAEKINGTQFITDVRYVNEVEFIKKKGGKIIHIEQEGCKPANEEEAENDPLIKDMADLCVKWKHVGDGNLNKLQTQVTKSLNKISNDK